MASKAKESRQVLKARRKLKQQMETESTYITPEALAKMTKIMEYWILRHKSERISLKDKEIQLFDENKHSAQPHSRFINQLAKGLKEQMAKTAPIKPLEGRITS